MNNSFRADKNYARNGVSVKSQNVRPRFESSEFFKLSFEKGLKNSFNESSKVKTFFRNQMLNSLTDDDFERLLPHLELVPLSSGKNIYQPEDVVRFVYFPEDAVFSHFHILRDGRTIETAMIGREGVTGFSAISGSSSYNHFLQVSIGGKALRLNLEIIKEELNRSDKLRESLFSFASAFVAHISQRVVCNNHHLLDERFCTWLLMLLDRVKDDKLELTHEQIAGYLGVHRPSITHIAQKLREKNIIKYSRGRISILKRRELENSACECYARKSAIH